MRNTGIQQRINQATGANRNRGIQRGDRNQHMRAWANLTGGRIRGSGDNAYVSAS